MAEKEGKTSFKIKKSSIQKIICTITDIIKRIKLL